MVVTKKSSKAKEADDGNNQEVDKTATRTDKQDKAVGKKPAVAKAGKRSAKAVAEEEVKKSKEAKKSEVKSASESVKPKLNTKPPRTKLERRGKHYKQLAEQIDRTKNYSLDDAVDLAIKTSPTKFDASVELHVRLGVDPKIADQNVRGMVVLPAGSGKTIRVAVIAEADQIAAAKKAGADIAASDEFLQQLDKGKLDFDILIASPSYMPKLGKYARVLGPKGLMPNPKSGSVTMDVVKAVTEAKAGRIEYRVDSAGIVHLAVGKVSFGKAKLLENTKAVIESLKSHKPASVKGNYVLSAFITTTMGPSIRLGNDSF